MNYSPPPSNRLTQSGDVLTQRDHTDLFRLANGHWAQLATITAFAGSGKTAALIALTDSRDSAHYVRLDERDRSRTRLIQRVCQMTGHTSSPTKDETCAKLLDAFPSERGEQWLLLDNIHLIDDSAAMMLVALSLIHI